MTYNLLFAIPSAGNIGHFFVVLAFVSGLLSCIGFFLALHNKKNWECFSIQVFYVHVASVFCVIGVLFFLVISHRFDYHYVFSHTSRLLPLHYQISSFWEGQEGSFLLWIFWNVLIGIFLIHKNRIWRPSVMSILCLTQTFLTSMILGSILFGIKIGSSPFLLLREVIDAPIFSLNSEFIPEDGSGLNPLLQNYWMVIHPPTLFLGFATTVVPFAYCLGGLMTGKIKEWILPALPWMQFSALILGVGILMGAYWAYETLNFGGYWSWDPVENAIYVPWVVLIAAIHLMMVHKKSGKALKMVSILTISSFILVLYATFLTRSGVLSNTSVHSFTDLGLSGQLLIYLLAFLLFSSYWIIKRWHAMPSNSHEISAYSRQFWLFVGVIVLCFMAFQVLVGTSIPVYNQLAGMLGFELNMAPASDIYKAYSLPQMILSILLTLLSGTAQFFWWKKMDKNKLRSELTFPFLISCLCSGLVIYFTKISDPLYILLLIGCIYSVVANGKIFIALIKRNFQLSGGSIAHIGVALMLIGILFSSGYSSIISLNNTSMIWNKNLPDEINRDNLLLFVNEPRQMGKYRVVYRGVRKLTKEKNMIDENELKPTFSPIKFVDRSNGDTLTLINPENSYFEITLEDENKNIFTLFPRVQINQEMDMTVLSPDIKKALQADLYAHVSLFPDKEQEKEWSDSKTLKVKIGDNFFINDYVAVLEKLEPIKKIEGNPFSKNDIAVKAVIRVQGEMQNYLSEPIFIIKNNEYVGRIEDWVHDLGFKISIISIIPEENQVLFEIQTTQKDWIILKAVRKPWINLLWLGTLLLCVGLIVAIARRYKELSHP